MTHNASWIDRSASSNTSLLDPLISTETVLPGVAAPVTFTTLLVPVMTVSTFSAVANISGLKWSTLAIGLHPSDCWDREKKKKSVY